MDQLLRKLQQIRAHHDGRTFILADAKDVDMGEGIPGLGCPWPPLKKDRPACLSITEFRDQVRQIVRQGIVDIMLASVSTMCHLAHRERLFESSNVTPAIRANDTTDLWSVRGGRYRADPSLPFSTAIIEEAQYGSLTAPRSKPPVVNLGLYSMTFNNNIHTDRQSLEAFRDFRAQAQRAGFHYFLEVFAPNVDAGLLPDQVPLFVNDQIARTLAGVPETGRPLFLKIPYFGPGPLEELVNYDPSMVVGILGGSSGTTYDAFKLLAEAQKHGARAALFGRKIKNAESPLSFIRFMRLIVDGEITPEEAVKAYHGDLAKANLPARRSLAEDLQLTAPELTYAEA